MYHHLDHYHFRRSVYQSVRTWVEAVGGPRSKGCNREAKKTENDNKTFAKVDVYYHSTLCWRQFIACGIGGRGCHSIILGCNKRFKSTSSNLVTDRPQTLLCMPKRRDVISATTQECKARFRARANNSKKKPSSYKICPFPFLSPCSLSPFSPPSV
jgi:hypothetical protein